MTIHLLFLSRFFLAREKERSEPVKITLRRVPYSHAAVLVFLSVVALLGPDVQHHADGEEIEVANGYPDLHTPQQEQRRRYFPAAV